MLDATRRSAETHTIPLSVSGGSLCPFRPSASWRQASENPHLSIIPVFFCPVKTAHTLFLLTFDLEFSFNRKMPFRKGGTTEITSLMLPIDEKMIPDGFVKSDLLRWRTIFAENNS